jgi:hypothetical protein
MLHIEKPVTENKKGQGVLSKEQLIELKELLGENFVDFEA